MSRLWLVSDTHFYHDNIIKYCNRPFSNGDEMNRELIRRWNSVIQPGDEVWHLGDFIFGGVGRAEKIVSQLNGVITLIRGNHDKHLSDTNFKAAGVARVVRGPIEFGSYLLSHDPIVDGLWQYNRINVHGHIHEKLLDSYDYINISVEHTNYTPILASDLPRIHEEQMNIDRAEKITIQRYKEGLKNRNI